MNTQDQLEIEIRGRSKYVRTEVLFWELLVRKYQKLKLWGTRKEMQMPAGLKVSLLDTEHAFKSGAGCWPANREVPSLFVAPLLWFLSFFWAAKSSHLKESSVTAWNNFECVLCILVELTAMCHMLGWKWNESCDVELFLIEHQMSVKEYCSVYSGATGGAVAQFGEVMSLRNLKCKTDGNMWHNLWARRDVIRVLGKHILFHVSLVVANVASSF